MRIDFMKSAVLFALMLTASIFAVAQEADIKSANAAIKKADRFLDLVQPTKAIEVLNQEISKNPLATKLYYYLGRTQLKMGDKGQALKSFEKGAANEKEALCQVGLGAVRITEKKTAEAKAFFDKALNMTKSKDVEVLQAVAEAYLIDPKNAEEALKLLEKAKSLKMDEARTFYLLAEVAIARNQGGAAVSNNEYAIKFDGANGKPYYNIAMVYQRSQNTLLTEENLQKAVSVDPEYTLAYKELGELYYSKKDGDKAANGDKAAKAQEMYLKLKENPDDQEKTRWAYYLIMAKNFAKAIEVLDPLIEKPNVSPTTVKAGAFAATESGDLAKAQRLFEKYFGMITEDKIEAGDYNYFAELLTKQKNDTTAIKYWQKSLKLQPTQTDIGQKVAETYFRLRKYNETIAAYLELFKVRQTPLSADLFRLGQAYYNTSQFEKADTVFTKFVELQSKITLSYLWLGRTKAQLDPDAKLDLAKVNYDKVVEIASPTPETGTNKKDLIESYEYLGFYYSQRDNLEMAKSYFEKVLALDPANKKANEVIKLLKEGQKQQKPKPQR